MGENNSNVDFDSPLSNPVETTSHLNEIVVEIIQEGANAKNKSILPNNKSSLKKRTKSSKIASNDCTGYKQAEKTNSPKVKPQIIDREPSKELLEEWRVALQKNRQVCCPHPECQLSYCSIRGLLLHYRTCSGKRNDEEIVKCKICCNYVSGRISLAHHNRLLHSGMPTKALNSFAESKKSFNASMHTTKSRRQVRKPARYREPHDGKEGANKPDDYIQNLSPMTSNERKSSKPCATITRLPSGTYKKEDFPEAVLKSSFLFRMGLAPTDVESNVVVLEDEIEDQLPSPLPEDAFKLQSDICNNIRANYTQLYQRTKTAKVDPPDTTLNSDVPPVKRKRGRPRKDKLKVVEPIINIESQKDGERSPKRKRRRKTIAKAIEPNEFLSVTACGLCWEEFKDQVSCDKHVATKHGTGPLDSEKLLMKEQKAKLQKMMRQHGILTCPNQHCKKPLLSITGYLNHIKNCKQEESLMSDVSNSESSEPPQPQKFITCRECKAKFTKDDAFESHALTTHHGLARVVGDDRPFTEDDRISAQKKMLKQFGFIPCPNCPKNYLSIQGLQYHLRTCKSDTCQDMVCNYCRLLFTNLQTFREHVIAKHNGLALPVGDERIYNQEEKQKILLQVLRLNQKLICLNDGCLEEFKNVENYLLHEESCLKAKPIYKIECGVCKLKFNTQPQFNNHAMIAHNGLARKNGVDQAFSEEEKIQALKKTLHVLKRLHCLREGCGKTFISLGGYQYHLSICGQESVSIECKVCGKKLKEASMRTHMKTSHPPTPPPPPPPKQEADDGTQIRSAAKRAREKVSEIARKLFRDDRSNAVAKSESSESEDSNYELPDSYKMYTKPGLRITTQNYSDWKKQLDSNGKATCNNTGCFEEFTAMKDMKRHFVFCKFSTLSLCYVCNICKKKCRREIQMQAHVDKMHSFGGIGESDSENEDGSSNQGQSGYGKFNMSAFRVGHDFEPLSQAADWTYDYYKRNYETSLFYQWLPDVSNWERLSELECQQYLPEETTSISFQVVDVIKKEKPVSTWTKLDRFTCKQQSDSAQINPSTLFVGGPVWAMAWCPTPANKVCDQYLTLSSHRAMEDRAPVSSTLNKPGLIQIWQVGDTRSNSSLESKFVLGIAHDFGDVWKLEWCPSGCWNDENNNNKTLPRLGLLAAACSDGKIYIFSVPFPDSLSKAPGLPICRVKPTIILQTEPVLLQGSVNLKIDGQCLTMSWERHKGHARIAGGFTNGYVALWNIFAESPLLQKQSSPESSNSEIIYSPYKIFRAHTDCVKDVVWAPFSNGKYIATVGWDRQVHVWSTEDINLPINSQKLGKLLSVAWSPYWCGVFVTQEECYNLWRTNLRFVDTGYFGNGSRCLAAHNGSIWQVSVNDWLNCTATCDSNGEVVGTVLTQLLHGVGNLKRISRKRFPIYRTNVCNLKTLESDVGDKIETNSSENSADNSAQDVRSDQSTTDSCDPAKQTPEKTSESYKETVTDYGIVFMDNVPISNKLIPQDEITRLTHANTMTSSDLRSFPIASINKVAWNPNLGSHLLVASGGNSGLIRIHRIHWLQQTNAEKLRVKLQMNSQVSDDVVNKVSSSTSDVDNFETRQSNCISPIKSSDIEWLKQANIEKIRSGLHAHTANKQQEIECVEKGKTENADMTTFSSCAETKSREIANQLQS